MKFTIPCNWPYRNAGTGNNYKQNCKSPALRLTSAKTAALNKYKVFGSKKTATDSMVPRLTAHVAIPKSVSSCSKMTGRTNRFTPAATDNPTRSFVWFIIYGRIRRIRSGWFVRYPTLIRI